MMTFDTFIELMRLNQFLPKSFFIDLEELRPLFTTVVRIPIDHGDGKLVYAHTPREWLEENIGVERKDWRFVAGGFWLFNNENDAALFKLRWG